MISAVYNPFLRGFPPPRGNAARLWVGFFGFVLMAAGISGTASLIRNVGVPGHGRQVIAGMLLALFGLGMLLTAVFRKADQVPFDW
jgi:uncharacterized membrane protein HdeD (DUF308 family)